MLKRSSIKPEKKKKVELIKNQIADKILVKHLLEQGKNPAAVLLGRLGGLKGGKARAAKLSAEERQEIARNAARIRWSNSKTKNI